MTEGRTIRATQMLGREAVDIDSGTCAGTVRDLLLSKAGHLVCAGIHPQDWFAPGLACPPQAIVAASNSRLLFGGCGPLRKLNPPKAGGAMMWTFIHLKPLVSRAGEWLGVVEDLAFDLPSGAVLSAFVSLPSGRFEEFRVRRITASGPDCVIAELWNADVEAEQLSMLQRAQEATAHYIEADIEDSEGAPEDYLQIDDDEAGEEPEEVDAAGEVETELEAEMGDDAGTDFPVDEDYHPDEEQSADKGPLAIVAGASQAMRPPEAADQSGEVVESSEANERTAEALAEYTQAQPSPGPHRLLPKQLSQDEIESRLAELLHASAGAMLHQEEMQAELAAAPGSTAVPAAQAPGANPPRPEQIRVESAFVEAISGSPTADSAEDAYAFRALEALVAKRQPRIAERSAFPEPKQPEPAPLLFEDSQAVSRYDLLPPFERRKALFLTGRTAHRDIRMPDGSLLARAGEELSFNLVEEIIATGQLDSVFLEYAAVTR
jgi:uncharacterized protein YrrD